MKILIPATSANLGPGFDTLGLALDLHNEVNILPSSLSSISIKGEGAERARLKTHNSFVAIFDETYKKLTGEKGVFRFEFHNKIPLSRGLGSSSAVIVGAIGSAYEMAKVKIDKKTILNEALIYEAHPDNIAPATYGGFTVSLVENGNVYVQQKILPKDICAVLIVPNRPMSTAKSRTQLPKNYSMKETVFNLSHAASLSVAFFNESWDMLRIASKDIMHESRRMKQLPVLFEVRKTAFRNGALMSTLSGSGSTFLNVVYKNEAKKLQNALKSKFPQFKVGVFNFDNEGFFIQNS